MNYLHQALKTAAVFFMVYCGCSKPEGPDDQAGGGHPIPNPSAVYGIAAYKQGITEDKEGIIIVLYKNTFDSTDIVSRSIDTTFTDNEGAFQFDTLAEGSYSMVFEKGAYRAFSGYFEYTGSNIALDTNYLSPTFSIVCMMREVDEKRVMVSLIGTPDSIVVETDNTFYPQDKYFVFKNSTAGDYKTMVILDYREPEEKRFYIPLPARDIFIRDTSYIDTTFGLESQITIINDMYSMANMYCRLTCFVE